MYSESYFYFLLRRTSCTTNFTAILPTSCVPPPRLSSLLPTPKTTPYLPPSKISTPFLFADSPSDLSPLSFELAQPHSVSSKSTIKGVSSVESSSGFPSTVKIAGLNSRGKSGGPAFVGQVFNMCDLSRTGPMTVSTHFDIPFISKRIPEWIKKIFANTTKSERNGPVFHFFMDLSDTDSEIILKNCAVLCNLKKMQALQ